MILPITHHGCFQRTKSGLFVPLARELKRAVMTPLRIGLRSRRYPGAMRFADILFDGNLLYVRLKHGAEVDPRRLRFLGELVREYDFPQHPGLPILWDEELYDTLWCGTVSFVASATSTSSTIVIPAGAASGDFALLFDFAVHTTNVNPTEVVPTDFTQISTSQTAGSGPNARSVISYKFLVGGDPGATITGMNDDNNQKVLLTFRSDVGFSSATPSTLNSQGTNTNPAAQTVTASAGAVPLIVFGEASTGTATPALFNASTTPAFDATVGTTNRLLAGYKIYNASPADHTVDQDDLGTANILRSGYVALVETAADVLYPQSVM